MLIEMLKAVPRQRISKIENQYVFDLSEEFNGTSAVIIEDITPEIIAELNEAKMFEDAEHLQALLDIVSEMKAKKKDEMKDDDGEDDDKKDETIDTNDKGELGKDKGKSKDVVNEDDDDGEDDDKKDEMKKIKRPVKKEPVDMSDDGSSKEGKSKAPRTKNNSRAHNEDDMSDDDKSKSKKDDDVDVKESIELDELAIAESIKQELIEEGLWATPDLSDEQIEARKSIVENAKTRARRANGERELAVELTVENLDELSDMIAETGLIAEDISDNRVRIKFDEADFDDLAKIFGEEVQGVKYHFNMVDPETDKSLSTVFESLGLSEESKDAIAISFEAAVNEKTNIQMASINESIDAKVEEKVQIALEAIDEVLEESIQEWIAENKPAALEAVKAKSLSEAFESIKTILEDTGVSISEDSSKLLDEMAEENTILRASIKELQESQIQEKTSEVEEICEGVANELKLSEMQTAKLVKMSEGFTGDNLEHRIDTLARTVFAKKSSGVLLEDNGSHDDADLDGGFMRKPEDNDDTRAAALLKRSKISF